MASSCCCFEFLGRGQTVRSDGRPKGRIHVLVGMRAAGKSTLGRVASQHLKRQLLDLDTVLEEKVLGCKIGAFVDREGWAAFRAAEAKLLDDVVLGGAHISDPAAGCIVATGGGVVESPSAAETLKKHTPVVWIDRHIDDIIKCLEGVGSYRPGLGEPPRSIFERRRPLYEACSDYIFSMRRGDEDWPALGSRFARLVRWADVGGTGLGAANPVCAPIVAEALEAALADIREAATEGAGLVELRLDKLAGGPEVARRDLPPLLAAARSRGLVVVATMRPTWEDGNAGYSGQEGPRMQVLSRAAELGADYVDVERSAAVTWRASGGVPPGSPTKLVCSSHDFQRLMELEELRALICDMRALAGPNGVVKVAQMPADAVAAARVLQILSEATGPTVLLAMGQAGMFTRLLAPRFPATAFTFGCLSGKASAPGQPTVSDMLSVFRLDAMTSSTKIFGLLRPEGCEPHCFLATVVNAGLSAAGVDQVCVPIATKGCATEAFLEALPQGLLVGSHVEEASTTTDLAGQAQTLFARICGAAPAPEASEAMRAAAAAATAARPAPTS